MKLYRVVHKNELKNMLNNDKSALGAYPNQRNMLSSTFHYDTTKKYLHFFYNKNACQNIFDLNKNLLEFEENGNVKDYFIVSFNIPLSNVINNTSWGFYTPIGESNSGYDYSIKRRLEAVIEAKDFDKNWVSNVEIANFKYFDKSQDLNR